ncbi:MAG: DNA mismatch repair endonuclease MutL [Anaerolineae bacterium]|nr:DNA mismatch repair endonuclease MutL [Anaerolineae bacterium]
MTIHVLSSDVIAQIAAGEVVERPASVVKELIENALDAEAGTISVEMQEGGKRLIRVSDNGSGIPSEEAELAVLRHATSKLMAIDDLDRLTTLGFRGEALAAIASISRMSLVSRAAGESAGTSIRLEGGCIMSREAIGAPQGTVITVENLFYNTPARLKFLKKETTERQAVNALVSRYAMAYPHVRFILHQGNQEVLHTTGSGELRGVLAEVYGIDMAAEMLEVVPLDDIPDRPDLAAIEVYGFAGLPSLNRSNRNQITLFVNGRWVQDANLTYAVVQAYHTMLMVGRYPVATLLITLPPEEVDVNVHPTKAQVRFRQADAVFSAVQRAVRHALVEHAPPPTARGEVLWGSADWAARRDRLAQITGERMSQLGLSAEGIEETGQYAQQRPPEEASTTELPERKKRVLPMLRVIGQVGGTYVVAEGPRGLYLIDQHAAHERILFEQFMAERQSGDMASQELLEAVVIELAPDQMALVEGSLDDLQAVGFHIEVFGRSAIRVLAIPALVAQGDPGEALLAALGEIECGEMPTEATAEQKVISRVCKQAAIKAGQILSFPEMEALIRRLEGCQSPQTCPHGRPTMIHISAEELAKQFGRLGAI